MKLAGPYLLWSLVIAGIVASLNAWSTAALARVHPVAGGAYAYGRIRLGRAAGNIAGIAFVLGKIASSGAAALTIGTYVAPAYARWIALMAILIMISLDLRGVTRTAIVCAVSAAIVLAVLLLVISVAISSGSTAPGGSVQPLSPGPLGILAAAGILFVAFAGYARVATLGEEVKDPERTLPWAIASSIGIVLVVYLAVGAVVLRFIGPLDVRETAPLRQLAAIVSGPGLVGSVRFAAVVAAGGALLSLLAGVGRTLFAMSREGDAPGVLAQVSATGVPQRAQVAAAVGAGLVALAGGIAGALAVSGASILTYYSIAHLAAMRMRSDEPHPPRIVPILGLAGCALIAVAIVIATRP
jgi:APA family basic amino acid/polyamine antiporter